MMQVSCKVLVDSQTKSSDALLCFVEDTKTECYKNMILSTTFVELETKVSYKAIYMQFKFPILK